MTEPRWTFIPDILEEHLEGLAFLWAQRQATLRDPATTFPRFRELERRITAHRDGIRAVGADARALLEEMLASEDGCEAFAGACGLLDPAVGMDPQVVLDAFETAEDARLDGLRMALAHVGDRTIDGLLTRPRPAPTVAVAAAEVLAFHRRLDRSEALLLPFLTAEDAALRAAGWRVVACAVIPVSAEHYAAAARDEELIVVQAMLEAGAWCGVRGVLEAVRQAARTAPENHVDALPLLGILGTDADLGLMRELGSNEALGPGRFALLVAGGRTDFIDLILDGMENEDPSTACAAGVAFTKLTGLNIDSTRVVEAEPSTTDPFEQEFADTYTLPDAGAARREWDQLTANMPGVRYLAGGRDIGRLDGPTFAAIDMCSRFEICLRSRFYSKWPGTLVDVERYPQHI